MYCMDTKLCEQYMCNLQENIFVTQRTNYKNVNEKVIIFTIKHSTVINDHHK